MDNSQIKIWTAITFNFCLVLAIALSVPSAWAQGMREVRGNTIVSPQLPKADLTFGDAFHDMGARHANLYGIADAEIHLFVRPGKKDVIEAFYWVQFEHRLPSDQHTYNYPADHTTEIGGLNFVYDAKSWPDFASELMADPASDGAAVSGVLAESKLKFPDRVTRIRMFHLPTPDRRTELMIIYGEALPENSLVPVRKEGVDLMKEDPKFAQKLLDDLKANLTIHTK
jgi:hypothetical protein